MFAAASSNAMSGVGVQVGSFLELDNVGFAGPGVTQQLVGGTFETWTTESVISLLDWNVNGEQGFSRVSPGHTGNYAVQLVTQDYGTDGVHPSQISLGNQSQSGPIGGIPFTTLVDTLCGYYKYSTSGSDQAFFLYNLMSNGMNNGGDIVNFGPVSNWTYFEIPLNPMMTLHDTLNLTIQSSSNWPIDNTTAGSTLILDDIHFKSQQVGLKSVNPFDMIISAYPNPTTDMLNLKWNKQFNENVTMNVYSIRGQLISSEVIVSGNNTIQLNVKNFAKGAYLISITSLDKTWKTSFIKE